MSYVFRNSLALMILLVVVMGSGGYVWGVRQAAKIEEHQKTIAKFDRQLARLPNLIAEYHQLTKVQEDQHEKWNTRSKEIPPDQLTGDAYAYFSSLIDRAGGTLRLDMVYKGTETKDRYGHKKFTLKGEAPFLTFYRFLWYLENGERMYRVNQIYMRGVSTVNPTTRLPVLHVSFTMELRDYFTKLSELFTSPARRPVNLTALTHNPLQPLILAIIPPNVDNLIESERSELIAIFPDKAILMDHRREVREIRIGDRVYLGYVNKIAPEESMVEFMLNKGGIAERFRLSM